MLNDPQIVAGKQNRWRLYLRAALNGRLLDRPPCPVLWRPRKEYLPPIFDRLQSSYEDCEFELQVATAKAREKKQHILFVAGDGLLLMRLNHLLAQRPNYYINQSPLIIPIQGLHPPHIRPTGP